MPLSTLLPLMQKALKESWEKMHYEMTNSNWKRAMFRWIVGNPGNF